MVRQPPWLKSADIVEVVEKSGLQINNGISARLSEGSSWTVEGVNHHYVHILRYGSLNGASYIELPASLRGNKRGLTNIKNEDDRCFMWCLLAHKLPDKTNPQWVKEYEEHVEKVDFSGVTFPVKQKHYSKTDENNNIGINVFGYEDKKVIPVYISKGHY